jgi:hypothetical protein
MKPIWLRGKTLTYASDYTWVHCCIRPFRNNHTWRELIAPKHIQITRLTGYLERGFVSERGDLETLTDLLGHSPRRYEDFARQTTLAWQQSQELLLAS